MRKRARRRVRCSGAAKAIMRLAPARRDRHDSDVAEAVVRGEAALAIALVEKHSLARVARRCPLPGMSGVVLAVLARRVQCAHVPMHVLRIVRAPRPSGTPQERHQLTDTDDRCSRR